MPEVLVIGGDIYPFARYKDGSNLRDWSRAAIAGALRDADIDAADLDAVVVGMESDHLALQLSPGALLADNAGILNIPVERVEAGGASGAAAVRNGYAKIRAGLARSVLVLGAEHAASHLRGPDTGFIYGLSFDADFDGFAGLTPANLYALSIAAHQRRYGTTEAQMAAVSVKNRANAVGNPSAHTPSEIGIQDVMTSQVVSAPYKRLDCSPLSDGAAAIVLAADDWAPVRSPEAVRITGSGSANDSVRLGDRQDPGVFAAKTRAALQAYDAAAVTKPANEIDVAEVYDAFTGAEIQALEALGFSAPGGAGRDVESGRFGPSGRLPVNVSGGLIGQGGAPGAVGVAQIVTLARLLAGRHSNQPAGPSFRTGLADAHGGIGTVCVVHVLEKITR